MKSLSYNSKKKFIFLTFYHLKRSHLHFGVGLKKNKIWNPNFKNFISEIRNNIPIFDLFIMIRCYKRSLYFLKKIVLTNGGILICQELENLYEKKRFLGKFEIEIKKFKNEIKRDYNCFFTTRWQPGTLSALNSFRKKSQIKTKLLNKLKYLPDLCIMNYHEGFTTRLLQKENKSKNMIKETVNLSIPSIILTEKSFLLEQIAYPIIGNTTSITSQFLFYNIFMKSIFINKNYFKSIFIKKKQRQN